MTDKTFCRIGVFYDGSYFNYAQRYFYHNRGLGWLDFKPFHRLLEDYVRSKEQGYGNYKIVYAAWFQGMFPSSQATDKQLKFDRNQYHDLMHADIEPKYLPTSQQGRSEKGADVALAIDALQIGLEGKIPIAVLVSGDGDLIPLARALMKHGIRVVASYFEYNNEDNISFINERLRNVCNYDLNINALESDRNFRTLFKSLLRKPEDTEDSKGK